MTPVTGATFPTAVRRSGPCFKAEHRRRTSILLSAGAGRARLLSAVILPVRCRKRGSVPGWSAPHRRLTSGGLGARGSAPLVTGIDCRPPASSPALELDSRRSKALDPTWNRAPVGQSLNPDVLAAPLPQTRQRPGTESARPSFDGVRPWADGMSPPDGNRLSTSRVQPRFGAGQQPLEGVDPTWDRAPVGQSLNPDAERRILIEQWSFGRVPPTAVAPPLAGLRASPSFSRVGSTHPLGYRRFFRPLVGVGAQPLAAGGPGAIGIRPFNGQGPQTPSRGMGASGGTGGR